MGWTPPHSTASSARLELCEFRSTNGERSQMKLTRVGVDLAKSVFQLHGVDRAERSVWCKRLKRNRWIKEIEQNVEPGAQIGMEACGGAPDILRQTNFRT